MAASLGLELDKSSVRLVTTLSQNTAPENSQNKSTDVSYVQSWNLRFLFRLVRFFKTVPTVLSADGERR